MHTPNTFQSVYFVCASHIHHRLCCSSLSLACYEICMLFVLSIASQRELSVLSCASNKVEIYIRFGAFTPILSSLPASKIIVIIIIIVSLCARPIACELILSCIVFVCRLFVWHECSSSRQKWAQSLSFVSKQYWSGVLICAHVYTHAYDTKTK